MKKLVNLAPGKVFTYAKERFVVLEQTSMGSLVMLEQSKESVPFNESNDGYRNNYATSTLRRFIEGEWLQNLIENGADESDMLDFVLDLAETDGGKGYGTFGTKAAPLSLRQYGKYKEIIPLNEDDAWWLVTPLWAPWLRSPFTGGTGSAWLVNTSGEADYSYVAYSHGVRPALYLTSELLVSVDDDVEEDTKDVEKALANFDTLTLIREVERRMTQQKCECGCNCEDDEE